MRIRLCIALVCTLALGSVAAMAQDQGTAQAWGHNFGTLSDGTFEDRSTPVPVNGLTNVTAVCSGSLHTLALLSDGTVMAWGNNQSGQLGEGTLTPVENTPVQVSGLANVMAIASGSAHSLALLSDGTVMAWGNNELWQLGDGTFTNRNTPVPVAGLYECDCYRWRKLAELCAPC
jgi:alpha-tubulin suppressor-like RCC1 family protein